MQTSQIKLTIFQWHRSAAAIPGLPKMHNIQLSQLNSISEARFYKLFITKQRSEKSSEHKKKNVF
jgi:hypothetical protein